MDRPALFHWRRSLAGLIGARGVPLLHALAGAAAGLALLSFGDALASRLQTTLGGHGYFPPVDWGLAAAVIGAGGVAVSVCRLMREGGAIILLAHNARTPARASGIARLLWTGQEEAWLEVDDGEAIRSFPVPSSRFDEFLRIFSEPASVEVAWIGLPEALGGDCVIEISERRFEDPAVA